MAEDWRWLNDRTIDFKLREGVRFHNGEKFNAEAVFINWENYRKMEIPNGSFFLVLPDETLFEIIDEYKKSNLRFDLEHLDAALIPVYSVSSSEGGFERNLQQVCLFFIKDIEKSNKFTIDLTIEKI